VRPLDQVVWGLLREAAASYRDSRSAVDWLGYHMRRYTEPLRIAVAGPPGAGKSTLVNALIGEEIAPIQAEDGTALPTWYQDGRVARASVYSPLGPARELPVTRLDRGLRVDTGGWWPRPMDRVVVDWPTRTLRELSLIDTPGRHAGQPEPPAEVSDEADAVLYLTRHPHGLDLGFQRSTAAAPLSPASPVNTILVLSRADELGAGRIDALGSARRIARRQLAEPGVWTVCQDLVAVSGTLALAGKTLRDDEFALLRVLAEAPREPVEQRLLSAERFLAEPFPAPVDPAARHAVLAKFGIFGVRLAVTLVRRGADTPVKLSAQLIQRSGLGELREAMGVCFTDRRQVLKARSALVALAALARSQPHPHSARLTTAVEGALAGAHEFRELRQLARLRAGIPGLPPELAESAARLLGEHGTAPTDRLGLLPDAAPEEVRAAAEQALRFWQDQAADPPLGIGAAELARTVLHSCATLLPAPVS
jgi:hypothetical protein